MTGNKVYIMSLKKGDMFGDIHFGYIYVYMSTICADSIMAELRVFDVISSKFVEINFLSTYFVIAGHRMIGKI